MRVVDTSIWIDFWRGRASVSGLAELLREGHVLMHPWVLGEVALGSLGSRRGAILDDLAQLPASPVVPVGELLAFVEHHRLAGSGLGFVDVQILASTRLANAELWTGDRRLLEAWRRLATRDMA
ncbi:MAG: PIN domain-containing protein [Planctomycetota bacterium]|nr:PIN domain-containing protein [Planctomycetota bacterium]